MLKDSLTTSKRPADGVSRHSYPGADRLTYFALSIGVVLISAAHSIPAQKPPNENPDVVRKTNGAQIRCRVLAPNEGDNVLVLVDGKRKRIRRSHIATMTTVNDHLRDVLDRRLTARPSESHDWLLVEQARTKGLSHTANMLAHHMVLAYPEHRRARELLGHKRRGGRWVWPLNGKYVTFEQWAKYHEDDGHPLKIRTLHYEVETTCGLRRAVDCLLDLERFYLLWLEELAGPLGGREVLEPMRFIIRPSADQIPPLTGQRLPYYIPDPNGDFAVTFYSSPTGSRPDLLFALALEHVFYHALIETPSIGIVSPRNRVVAWAEMGLGQWFESRFSGPPGAAVAEAPVVEVQQAELALQARSYGLENMVGLRYGMFHDLTNEAPVHWATTATFVAFLMREKENGETPMRAPFLKFLRSAYRESRGNSSSLLDKALGQKIERVEREYALWLSKKTGVAIRRRRK